MWYIVWSLVIVTLGFLYGLRFNTFTYMKCLEEEVQTWIGRVDAGRPYLATGLCAMLHKQPQAPENLAT